MSRNLRDSTSAKSIELNTKLRQRELQSKARKSRKLIKQTDRNKASLDEAIQLSVVPSTESSSNQTDSSDKDTNPEEDTGVGSREEFWYDTSHTELIESTTPINSV